MNSFQLLKSGTSFSRDKISKVDKLFKKSTEVTKVKPAAKVIPETDEDDKLLIEIDEKIVRNKESVKTASVGDIAKLQAEYKSLLNRRKDAMIKLRKKHRVTVDGAGAAAAAELIPSFQQMAKKLNLSPAFM